MAQKNNRRAKIVGTDIEVDITEKKDVIIESHDEDHEHDHHHKETFITKYIFSIDHKMISKQYLITGLIMGIVGIAMSLLFRLQLAWPEESFGIFDVSSRKMGYGWCHGSKCLPSLSYNSWNYYGILCLNSRS